MAMVHKIGKFVCAPNDPRNNKLAWVCPISGGEASSARDSGFLISLMGYGLRTDGNVHVHQLKAFDLAAHRASKLETVPAELMEQVLACTRAVLDDE